MKSKSQDVMMQGQRVTKFKTQQANTFVLIASMRLHPLCPNCLIIIRALASPSCLISGLRSLDLAIAIIYMTPHEPKTMTELRGKTCRTIMAL